MKKSLLYLAAFAGLTACVQDLKEDVVLNPAENNGLALTINATMDEPQTRVVTEDGLAFKFAANDEIGVYFYHPALASKTIANVKFTAKAAEEGKVQFFLPEDQNAYASAVSALLTQENTKIYSYAPYKTASGSVEGGIVLTKSGDEVGDEVGADVKVTRNFTLPTNQNAADDVKSVADHYAVVAKSVSPVGDDDGKYTADLNYSGIYALAKFTIVNTTNRSLDVTGFRYTVGEGKALTGKFTADLADDPKFPVGEETDKYTLTPVENETKNYVEVDFAAAPVTLAAGKELPLYVVINSGVHAPGATIEVMANPTGDALVSHVYSKKSTKERTFSRNERQRLTVSLGTYDCEIKVTEEGKDKVVFINSTSDLKALAQAVNGSEQYLGGKPADNQAGKIFVLTADLDFGKGDWEPIGNVNGYPSKTFAGTFDGNGKTISNLTVRAKGDNGKATAGLFGSITGVVKNLTLKNVNIESTHYAGAIAGYSSANVGMKIENCHVIGGTITSTPEDTGRGVYDNGDKAGAIIGYMVEGDQVVGCTVEGVTIQAYRDLGGIAGYSRGTVQDCEVRDIKLIIDATHNYKRYSGDNPSDPSDDYKTSDDYDANAIVGDYVVEPEGNKANNVTLDALGFPIKGGDVYYRFLEDALIAEETEIELHKAREYELDEVDAVTTATLNITGLVDGVKLTYGKNVDMSGVTATFNKVTLVTPNKDKIGFKDAANVTFNNCKIENTYWCYNYGNAKTTFNSCIFNQDDAEAYNIWTYGSNVDFNGCDFYSAGRAALIYDDETAGWKTVKFNDCDFFATAAVDGNAAIEIDSSVKSYNVYINGGTNTGFAAGSMSGNTLYNLKNGYYGDDCFIYLDGTRLETVYQDLKYYFAPKQEWLKETTPVKYMAYFIDENGEDTYAEMTLEDGLYSCVIPGDCEKVQFYVISASSPDDTVGAAMMKTGQLEISRNGSYFDGVKKGFQNKCDGATETWKVL